MKRFLLILALIPALALKKAAAQTQDSVVQLYGVVMTADSLRALPNVSVMIKGQNRGTVTNERGIFSIVALKGDQIEFSSIGFKSQEARIPHNLEGSQHSLLQLMVTDTVYLPVAIIKPRPSKEQFARDFVNAKVDDDELETARKNNDEVKKRVLLETLPADGREAVSMSLANNAKRYYYSGQAPPQNIFNPIAWGKFIKAWKRGDFKRKKK